MRRSLAVVLAVSFWAAAAGPAAAQTVAPPQVIGPLVGPRSAPAPAGLQLYGTDLGWTFEHAGRLLVLFGDTWARADSLCDGEPLNDDTQATLPLAPPAGLPQLTFATRDDAPTEFDPLVVRRGSESLPMGYGQVPLTGFSDGTDAIAVFGRSEYVPCGRRSPRGRLSCRPHEHLACTQQVGVCTPALVRVPTLCDLASNAGCILGTTCQPTPTGFCVDPTSSQNDGTAASLRFTVAHDQEIAVQDVARSVEYRSAARLATNKFINATARTVRCFTGQTCGSDYGVGHGALLMWGRPGFTAEQGRQAQLYLMVHPLPIRRDRSGRMRLRPRYFAGLRPGSDAPRWTRRESQAAPLALDGVQGGSPHEEQPIVDQMAISWIGEPVNRWMMLYGGDLADYLLLDPARARPGAAPGAIRVRFAEHPWGPWSAAEPHLLAGSPSVPGDAYGPGGILFHTLCADQAPALCAPGDPTRPPDFFLPGCPPVGATFDVGHFYGPNIIDAYTRADGAGGADVFWSVSTWDPYGVVLLRSTVRPGPSGAPAACGATRGRRAGYRWCAGEGPAGDRSHLLR